MAFEIREMDALPSAPHPGGGRPVVLVVDDTPQNIALVSEVLKEDFQLIVAISGAKALQLLESGRSPDLVLLDVTMPVMDGYELMTILRRTPRFSHIPVMFVSARGDRADQKKGLALGAVDFIVKPFDPDLLLARVHNHVALKLATDALRTKANGLEQEVQQRMSDIQHIQEVTMLALASLAGSKHHESSAHIMCTRHLIVELAHALRKNLPKYGHLPEEYFKKLLLCAALHDIGMVSVPDSITLKPGPLGADEIEEMRRHARIGAAALEHAGLTRNANLGFLDLAREICLHHHERWDGQGYPDGLSGEQIPLSARLMHIVDVYDALTSSRGYRPAYPHDEAMAMILAGKGTEFDPEVCEAFFSMGDRIVELAGNSRNAGRG